MSDKRRSGASLGSASHILRTTAMANSAASPSASSSSPASAATTTSAANRSSIIAPPPRAALQGPSTSVSTANADDGTGGGKSSGRSTPSVNARHKDDGSGGSNTNNNGSSSNSSSHPGRSSSGNNSSSDNAASAAQAALNAAAAATQLVKEKDLKIAALERELATMEAEFGRELDKLSQNESEAAAFWQSKHSSLNQQFLRADTELRLLRNEVELREAERGELSAEWEAMRRDIEARDREARELRAQVRGLKDFVSTSTRSAGLEATSDEVFAEGFARLGNGLQNWVIVNFRRTRLDLSRASEPVLEELRGLVPTCEELAASSKLHLLQSLVSRILVEMVFDSYYFGLTAEQAAQFVQMELLLTAFAGGPGPGPGMETVNQWRSATLSILSRDAPLRMKDETARLTDQIVARVNRLLDAVLVTENNSSNAAAAARAPSPNPPSSPPPSTPTTTTTSSSPPQPMSNNVTKPTTTTNEARDNALRQLVASAVELSRLLVVQRASFIVIMPEAHPSEPRLRFDRETMEEMGGRDEDSLADADVRCVTFPGVIKRGDESGAGLGRYENVICKARVLCASSDSS